MDSNKTIIDIIKICCSVDEHAVEIYKIFSNSAPFRELSLFWEDLSKDEKDHVSYWHKLLGMADEGMVPQVFENPVAVKKELEGILPKVFKILEDSKKKPDIPPNTPIVNLDLSPEEMANMTEADIQRKVQEAKAQVQAQVAEK